MSKNNIKEELDYDQEQFLKSDFTGFGDNLFEEEESSLFTPLFSSKHNGFKTPYVIHFGKEVFSLPA